MRWVVALCAGLAACSTTADPPASPAYVPSPAPARLMQHGFGDDARFAYCRPPDCPVVTPKSLPGARTPAAPLPADPAADTAAATPVATATPRPPVRRSP
ncbi:hypothetical protein [Xanthomonas hortorum]|uniref:Uncharacterized protein n=1 Tax=Xanthomonas hortorum pv. hederae TaxID=453603 RepID=A0A9X4BNZ1_9XANT|nr:hypothetical protein [Xanthomonas hortorum]MCE4369675.1 hypothetical protein [Xanthomonas hortorum pv. hederae]MDC8637173.1 hypothetical protein [Xanthomonas hortorum pv. hederae]